MAQVFQFDTDLYNEERCALQSCTSDLYIAQFLSKRGCRRRYVITPAISSDKTNTCIWPALFFSSAKMYFTYFKHFHRLLEPARYAIGDYSIRQSAGSARPIVLQSAEYFHIDDETFEELLP